MSEFSQEISGHIFVSWKPWWGDCFKTKHDMISFAGRKSWILLLSFLAVRFELTSLHISSSRNFKLKCTRTSNSTNHGRKPRLWPRSYRRASVQFRYKTLEYSVCKKP